VREIDIDIKITSAYWLQPVARGLRILLIHSKNYCMHWYVPSISSIPLLQGITWDPTWKATPSKMKPDCRLKGSRRKKGVQSVFRAFPFEIHSWFQLAESRNQFRGRQQANWLGALWFPWTRYCFDPNNELISQIGCSAFEEAVRAI